MDLTKEKVLSDFKSEYKKDKNIEKIDSNHDSIILTVKDYKFYPVTYKTWNIKIVKSELR